MYKTSCSPALVTVLVGALLGLGPLAAAAAATTPAMAAPAPPATPAPPAMPAVPAMPAAPSSAQLDAQLEQAQRELERAAHDVARLSTELSSNLIEQVMPLPAPHVILGVQLEPGPNDSGARVREVSPGGPAAEAGVRPGDVLLALNGTELKGHSPAHQVAGLLREVKPDSRVQLRLLREGKPLELAITARAAPGWFVSRESLPDFEFELPEMPGVLMHRPLTDLQLATLTPRLGSYFGSDKGVLVLRAPPDGALQLQDGDVILAIDGREPTSGSHATRILGSYQPGEKVTLRVLRQHKTLQLQGTLPERGERRAIRREAGALAPGEPAAADSGAGRART